MEKIFQQIIDNDFIIEENTILKCSMNNVKCYFDKSNLKYEDLYNKYVVYYIKTTDNKHYFGVTNSIDRRIGEHLRTDNRLFPYFINNRFYIKPIKFFSNKKVAQNFEKKIIKKAFLCLKEKDLLNKNF